MFLFYFLNIIKSIAAQVLLKFKGIKNCNCRINNRNTIISRRKKKEEPKFKRN